jgi:hypothetical protein
LKKPWHIILIHLGLQALIGGLVFIPIVVGYSNTFSGPGLVGGFVIVALGTIFASHFILVYLNKYPREIIRRGVIWGILFWFLAVPLLLAVPDAIRSSNYERQTTKIYQNESLKAIKRFGLKNLAWDPKTYRYLISPKSAYDQEQLYCKQILFQVRQRRLGKKVIFTRRKCHVRVPYSA